MARALAQGACVACGRAFSFDPALVPSVGMEGEREPVCLSCVEGANPVRVARGLPAVIVPPGAYGPDLDGLALVAGARGSGLVAALESR